MMKVSVLLLLLTGCLVSGAYCEALNLGDRYYRVGDWKRAVSAYESEVEEGANPEALVRLAESYYHLKRYQEAREVLKRAGSLSDRPEVIVLDILIGAGLDGRDEAVKRLTKLQKEDLPGGAVYTAMGIVEMARDYDKALEYFRAAIERDAGDFWAWFYIGTIYEERESLYEAMKAYKSALEINPLYAQAVNNLGYCYKELHFYEYAIQQYEKAIDLMPDKADFYYNVGNAYTLNNRIDDAFEAYRMAISLDPTFAKAHYNLGRTYVRKKMYEEAITEFELYLEYGNTFIFRSVASERSVRDEIERIEHYLMIYEE